MPHRSLARCTYVVYILFSHLLARGGRRQEMPHRCMHVHPFAVKATRNKYQCFPSVFPYGNLLRWVRHQGRLENNTFGEIPSASCLGVELRFQSTTQWHSGLLENRISRERQINSTTQLTARICTPFCRTACLTDPLVGQPRQATQFLRVRLLPDSATRPHASFVSRPAVLSRDMPTAAAGVSLTAVGIARRRIFPTVKA